MTTTAADAISFKLAQVFVDGVSFSHREDALQIPPNAPPPVGEVTISVAVGISDEGAKGLVRITVATRPENQPIYRVEISIVGAFEVAGTPNVESLRSFLTTMAPHMLYPFVREAFAGVTGRGRFGPIYLAPFNSKLISDSLQGNAQPRAEPAPAKSQEPTARRSSGKQVPRGNQPRRKQ
jgi:preprotein translocase subunit SecB